MFHRTIAVVVILFFLVTAVFTLSLEILIADRVSMLSIWEITLVLLTTITICSLGAIGIRYSMTNHKLYFAQEKQLYDLLNMLSSIHLPNQMYAINKISSLMKNKKYNHMKNDALYILEQQMSFIVQQVQDNVKPKDIHEHLAKHIQYQALLNILIKNQSSLLFTTQFYINEEQKEILTKMGASFEHHNIILKENHTTAKVSRSKTTANNLTVVDNTLSVDKKPPKSSIKKEPKNSTSNVIKDTLF